MAFSDRVTARPPAEVRPVGNEHADDFRRALPTETPSSVEVRMKLWIFSDLHLEFGSRFDVDPPPDADVAICAGDVLTKGVVPSLRWLGERLSHKLPVVFVGGNHEYYNGSILEGIADARALSDYPDLHYLENGIVEIDGITFVGERCGQTSTSSGSSRRSRCPTRPMT